MIMEIVNSDKEYEKIYWYAKYELKKYGRLKKYPKSYPCLVKVQHMDGGLCGDYVSHKVKYNIFPENYKELTPIELMYICEKGKWESI